jgi:hypothetical protein
VLKDTLSSLESAIGKLAHADPAAKAELSRLFTKLKAEIERLGDAQGERARSIAGFAELAAHEATRKEQSEKLQGLSRQGLRFSAEGLEASHPRLVETVNEICGFLAGLGI